MSDRVRTFGWMETREVLLELARDHDLVIDEARRGFRPTGGATEASISVRPPLVQPIAEGCTDVADFLASLPDGLGSRLVVLLQAGASALGLWHGDELVAHKCSKRYVKRGKGRAQPAYLKTKGKSRYGSRLRLQNARRLLETVHDKLAEWLEAHGEPEQMFYACPVRLWADLWNGPPNARLDRGRFTKIPESTRIPCLDELVRLEATLRRGRVEANAPPGT